jgi:hypothetical protein
LIHTKNCIRWSSLLTVAVFLPLLGIALAADTQPAPAADPGPSPVTMHVGNAPVSTVLADIARQTKITVNFPNNPRFGGGAPGAAPDEPLVTLDLEAQPFWAAIEQIRQQTGTTISQNQDGAFMLTRPFIGASGAAPIDNSVVAGPILIMPMLAEHIRDMTVAPADQEFCQLQFQLYWEPKLPVAFYRSSVVPTTAIDEQGNSLVPTGKLSADPRKPVYATSESDYTSISAAGDPGVARPMMISVRLQTGRQTGRRIAHLTGVFPIWFAQKTEHIEIPDYLNAPESNRDIAGMAVTISKVEQQFGEYSADIDFKRQNLNDADWNKFGALIPDVKIQMHDAAGNPLGGGGSGGSYGPTERSQNRRFRPNGPGPYTLTIDIPVDPKEMDVPFDLADYPVP